MVSSITSSSDVGGAAAANPKENKRESSAGEAATGKDSRGKALENSDSKESAEETENRIPERLQKNKAEIKVKNKQERAFCRTCQSQPLIYLLLILSNLLFST